MMVKTTPLLLALAMLVIAALTMPCSSSANILDNYMLNQGYFLLSEQESIPQTHEQGWRKVNLPHSWSEALPDQGGFGWYQMHRAAQVNKNKLWAVYLPLLNMNAAVYVNGQLIGSGGQFTEPIARHWNTPLYFLVPTSILQNKNNTISIRLKGYANAGTGLGGVYFGPDKILQPAYDKKILQRYTFPLVSFFFTMMLSVVSMFIWFLRREEPMYAWFSLSTAMYSLFLANHFVHNIPVSRYLWEWALHTSTEWCAFFLLMFTHGFFGIKRKQLERTICVILFCISLLLLTLPTEKNMFFFFNITHVLSLFLMVYIVSIFTMQWLKQKKHTPRLTVMLIFLCLIVFFAVSDLSIGLTPSLHTASFILSLSAPLLPIVLGWLLVYRFVRLQYKADSFAQEMVQEVAHTKQKLNQEFNVVRRLEKDSLISHERERMMQDLHDELGGQLVSACAFVNQKQDIDNDLKQLLNNALLDLRVVIDSLDDDNRNLSTLLGMLRTRLKPQLRIHGIELHFKLNDGPELDYFEQTVALNLLRIVQEAITNAIRHAHCSEIELNIKAHQGVVSLGVSDNGKGLDSSVAGRGMGNMKRRAKRIGAKLIITTSAKGTKIEVVITHVINTKPDKNGTATL